MIRHITYCSEDMTISAELCSASALKFGCDVSTIYRYEDLNEDFRISQAETLKEKRGAGYWVWKPQIILQEFEKCKFNDIVFYTDAGVEFINSVTHLLPYFDTGFLFFGSMYRHSDWCKGSVLTHRGDEKQLQASAIGFIKGSLSEAFIKEWLKICKLKGNIDDSDSRYLNAPGFQEHRHDQALLTELQLDNKIHSHWWPARYNNKFDYPKNEHKEDNYPVIFNHHRKRNNDYI